jgi:hypothetical protein
MAVFSTKAFYAIIPVEFGSSSQCLYCAVREVDFSHSEIGCSGNGRKLENGRILAVPRIGLSKIGRSKNIRLDLGRSDIGRLENGRCNNFSYYIVKLELCG